MAVINRAEPVDSLAASEQPAPASASTAALADCSPATGPRAGAGATAVSSTLLTLSLAAASTLHAAVLPEDRADALYHAYDGGGVEITGPSLLVVKQINKNSSVSGKYYVDSISGASIDVVTTASAYAEEREELSASGTYLYEDATLSLSYTNSQENDYEANSAHFGFSQEMFGNMTTLSLGYSRGWDDVGKSSDADFAEGLKRQNYRLGVSQVMSKNAVLNLDFEAITDEGFLNNPYRSVRYLDASVQRGYSYQLESYPETRTSSAVALRGLYYLQRRASIYGEFRYFNDTWGIGAWNTEWRYNHPYKERWLLTAKYRYYTQTHADFYSDLFPYQDAQNYLARDKELSTYTSHAIGFAISYELPKYFSAVNKSSINFAYDYLSFDYDDFRNVLKGGDPGTEPHYSFSANVLQLYLSVWY